MRSLVQPLPSMHCEHCDGELLFKRVAEYLDFDIKGRIISRSRVS